MIERGTHPGQRTVVDTLGGIAARVEAEGVRPPAITLVGPVAELRETIAWLERRPLHGEVVAVTRARAQASGLAERAATAGRRGGGDAGDPDRAAAGRGRAAGRDRPDRRVRARLLHEPERGAPVLRRAALPTDATLAPWPGRPWPPSARAPPRRSSTHGIRADVVPERSSRRPWSRRSRASSSMAGACSWRGPPRRAPCCPIRCASAAPRSTTSRSTTRSPSRSATPSAPALERATYVTFTSSSTVRFLLEARACGRRRARGSSRSARSRRATAAEHGLAVRRRGRAARHRRPRRRPGGRCRAQQGPRRDRHAPHRLRARRRLRRCLPRRDPRHPSGRRHRGHHARHRAVRRAGRARSCCATRCPTCRSASTWRLWTRRWAPSGGRSRCAPATGASSWALTTGCSASPGSDATRWRSPWTSPARRTGSSRSRPPSTGATSSLRWPRISPRAPSLRTRAIRSTLTRSSAWSCRSRVRRTAPLWRTRS